MPLPYIEFTGYMPRRLFAEMSLLLGEQVEELHQQASDHQQLVVYWKKTEAKQNDTETGWTFAPIKTLDGNLGCYLPAELWQSHLRIIEMLPNDEGKLQLNDRTHEWQIEQFRDYLELSLTIPKKGDRLGLYLAFNPQPNTEKNTKPITAICFSDGREPHPAEWPPALARKLCLLLSCPRLALLPHISGTDIHEIPPGETFFSSLWNKLAVDHRWQFRPKTNWCAVFNPVEPLLNRPASFVAIDFGTTATTIACLPEHPPADDNDLPEVATVAGLQPWTHVTYRPNNFENARPNGLCQRSHHIWQDGDSRIDVLFDAVPAHIRRHRRSIDEQTSGITPSLLYQPDNLDPGMTTDCTIGAEADRFLSSLKGSFQGATNPSKFVFSPKRLVGTDIRDPHTAHVFKPFQQDNPLSFHPIEMYLSEVFDQTLNQLHLGKTHYPLKSRIASLCYSYPVAWTKSQRDTLDKYLRRSFEKSFFGEYLHGKKIETGLDIRYLDEASAAFLGVTVRRFQGLEGDDLVRLFMPFEPDYDAARQTEKTMRVLVVDCGGGTSDMVLLNLFDEGKIGGDSAIQSSVLRHFAIDKGGIEITRRVAEYLKALLKKYDKLEDEQLRTNFFDEDVDKQFIGSGKAQMTIEDYRHRFTLQLYQAAEELKVALGRKQEANIDWQAILSGVQRFSNDNNNVGIDTNDLPERLDVELLKKWTRETYQYLINQIEYWFTDENLPAIDMLLLSGRSSQLPGLREAIIHAIPESKRPLAVDCAEIGNYAFNSSEDEQDAAKNLVSEGLVVNFWNIIGSERKKRIDFQPIDETRRTRAIGILAENISNKPLEYFEPQLDLLIESDNLAVNPEAEYIYTITKRENKGFYLGINFGGKARSDAPQPFLRVDIEGGMRDGFDKLMFIFQQLTTTEIRVKRIEVHKEGGVEQKEPGSSKEVQLGKLHIFLRPHVQVEDFRMTGRIHLSDPAIDSDRS